MKIIIISLMLIGCADHTKFEDYSGRSPVTEARDKIQRNQYVVYSAMGVGRYFPGIEQRDGEYIESRYTSIMLNNTSDAIESRVHAAYISSAYSFASAFNQEMVSHMRKHGLLPTAIEIRASHDGYEADGKSFTGTADLVSWIREETKGDQFRSFLISSTKNDTEARDALFKALAVAGYHNVTLK